MKVYDADWQEVADTSKGTVAEQRKALVARYVTTVEGEGHYETVKTYPGGGSDVEWTWDTEPQGEWRFTLRNGHAWEHPAVPDIPEWWGQGEKHDCEAVWGLYTPYTDEELQEQEEAAQAAQEAAQEAQEQAELIAALPDAVADLSESVSGNAEANSALADAVAELSQLVSDLMEANNG